MHKKSFGESMRKGRKARNPQPYRRYEQGITMLITLGFLAVLMMVTLSLAITTRTERRAATMNADLLRARMLAESGLDRAMTFLDNRFRGDIFPADAFYTPASGSPWYGRRYHAAINGADSAGIEDGLAVAINGVNITPRATLHPDVGWIPVTSTRNIAGVEREVLLGRYTYVIIDESGKIDPGAVVCPHQPETVTATRKGDSITEISLADAGIANADLYRPQDVNTGTPGRMPTDRRWFSLPHIVRALNPSTAEMQNITHALYPFSYDTETFWRDSNNDGIWQDGEDEERLDLTQPFTVFELYDLFTGSDKTSTDDDAVWLQEVDRNPWVQNWRATNGISILEARRRIAAQVAANIVDYADADSDPTLVYLDADGVLHAGEPDGPGYYAIRGVERTWGISEIALNLQVEIKENERHTISGNIHINPNNAPKVFFIMRTPSGRIDRDTLYANGPSYTYTGPATSVSVMPQSECIVTIDGMLVPLKPNVRYTIHSNSMNVHLRNDEHSSTSSWPQKFWIQIDATEATITPDPLGGKPDLTFTPAFKGEIFYPYDADAKTVDPPGVLTIMYTIRIEAATGKTGLAQGAALIEIDAVKAVDGGTLMYSSFYTKAGSVTIEEALDMEGKPFPMDWYKVTIAQIDGVTLKNAAEKVIADLPHGNSDSTFFCNWTQFGTSDGDANFYASFEARDPLFNSSSEGSPDFTEFWTVSPNLDYLASSDQSNIGTLTYGGYQSADYCNANVANRPFRNLGELGRVHSYQPLRSLRFWSANSAGETGHDADILDLFKIGEPTDVRGKVNVNSRQRRVLHALFKNAMTVDPAAAADAVLQKRNNGTTFRTIGQLFGGVAGISGTDPSNDEIEEAAVSKLAGLVTTRQNYFTVIVTAQSLQDIAGLRYDSNGDGTLDKTSAFNQLDVAKDSNGEIRFVDRILAEQKIMAVVYRDAYSGEMRVERYDYLTE